MYYRRFFLSEGWAMSKAEQLKDEVILEKLRKLSSDSISAIYLDRLRI